MTNTTPRIRTIAILGGGFAGITLAQRLQHRLPPGWQLMLVNEESTTTFTPMLAEVVGAAVFPEHVVAPIREILPATRFVMGAVRSIDVARRRVTCDTLAGPFDIDCEHLVLAVGQRANLALVPGMAEHALPLKVAGDAMHIRNRVLQRLARIELSSSLTERESLGHFIVIGGGFSGVEVAGALADFLRSALRSYPHVLRSEVRVTLVHDGRELLPELPAALGRAAARSLERRGVVVRLGARVAAVTRAGVELEGGRALAGATVLCTIGTRPHPLALDLGLPLARGRVATRADGSVDGASNVWAIGDCATSPNAFDGKSSPPTAQFAVAQAAQLADNLLRCLRGEPTRPFSYRARAMLATTGHLRGVAQVLGVPLSGLPAWLLWRAVYLLRMPTFGRKLRIWVEWTWGLCFPLDITHLRFPRTADIEAADATAARRVAPPLPRIHLP